VSDSVTRAFRWLAAEPIPATCDLRAAGWELRVDGTWQDDPATPVLLAVPSLLPPKDWLPLARAPQELRMRTLFWDVRDSRNRFRLLRLGFGDALDRGGGLDELATRTKRLIDHRDKVARRRQIGALSLDLLERQGWCQGRSLALHPREFGLLWRLSDEPGRPVSQRALLRDVWRLAFRPETNTVAVHISRLRAKLRTAGLDGLIVTLPTGGYRLALPAQFALDPLR
jgi:two-component system, OmpR family, response regulator